MYHVYNNTIMSDNEIRNRIRFLKKGIIAVQDTTEKEIAKYNSIIKELSAKENKTEEEKVELRSAILGVYLAVQGLKNNQDEINDLKLLIKKQR